MFVVILVKLPLDKCHYISVGVIAIMIAIAGCASGTKEEPKPAEATTEAVKAEEVTTEAPEVATTEVSMSEEDMDKIEKFWNTGGRIVSYFDFLHVLAFEKVYLNDEKKEIIKAEDSEKNEIKWTDESCEKEKFNDIILFFYKCDEIAKNLGKGEDVIELPDQGKEDFVKHEWKKRKW